MKRCCYCGSRLWPWQWKSFTVQGEAHAPCYFQMLERRTLDESLAVADAINRHGNFADGEPSLFPNRKLAGEMGG